MDSKFIVRIRKALNHLDSVSEWDILQMQKHLKKLIKKIQKVKVGDQQVIKTWARNSVITPEMVGFRLGIHNGREHISVLMVEDMVGHKLGEFSPTRTFRGHGRMVKRLMTKT